MDEIIEKQKTHSLAFWGGILVGQNLILINPDIIACYKPENAGYNDLLNKGYNTLLIK